MCLFCILRKSGLIIMDKKMYLDLFLWVVIGVFVGTIVYYGFFAGEALPHEPVEAPPSITVQEETVPPKVNITIIFAPDCEECRSVDYFLPLLDANLPYFGMQIDNIRNLTLDSAEAEELISAYDVELLPTLLISKNAAENSDFVSAWKENGIGTVEDDGTFVFRALLPPFYSVENSTVLGFVQGIAIEAENCDLCENVSSYLSFFELNMGVVFKEKKTLFSGDEEAIALIREYNVTRLPTFLIDSGIEHYGIEQQLLAFMTKEDDGWYVFREPYPPYLDVEDNDALRGNITFIELTDSTCEDCYNTTDVISVITDSYGMYVSGGIGYDISTPEGMELVERYDITFVPTFLLSEEASYYPDFVDVWEYNGNTVDSDGWFVFRNSNQLQGLVFRNISSDNTNETSQ